MTLSLVCGYWVSILDRTVYNDLLLCNPTLQPFVNLSHIYCLISAVCQPKSVLCLESDECDNHCPHISGLFHVVSVSET